MNSNIENRIIIENNKILFLNTTIANYMAIFKLNILIKKKNNNNIFYLSLIITIRKYKNKIMNKIWCNYALFP